MNDFGPTRTGMGGGLDPSRVDSAGTEGVQPETPGATRGDSVWTKIVNSFKAAGGRYLGAKPGKFSLSLNPIHIFNQARNLVNLIRGVKPPHTFTFQQLSQEKAREMMPSVRAAAIANAMDIGGAYLRPANNFGSLLRGSTYRTNLNLNDIDTTNLSQEDKQLLVEIKSMCSDEAYISPMGAIVDPNSGLRAVVTKDPGTDNWIVSFGSTGSREDTDDERLGDSQGKANFGQYLGSEPKVYSQARQLVGAVMDRYGDDKVSTAGHSLGGGLAQYSALYNAVPGKCFNPSPLGVGLQGILGGKIDRANDLIDNVAMRGDWLCHSGQLMPGKIGMPSMSDKTGPDTRPRIMSRIADLLGIRTRANFGRKYYINFDRSLYGTDLSQRRENYLQSSGGRHCVILNQMANFAR